MGQARRTAELRKSAPTRDRDGVLSGCFGRPKPWTQATSTPVFRRDADIGPYRPRSGSRANAPQLEDGCSGPGEVRSRGGQMVRQQPATRAHASLRHPAPALPASCGKADKPTRQTCTHHAGNHRWQQTEWGIPVCLELCG